MIDPSRTSSLSKAAGQHISPGGLFHIRAIAEGRDGFWMIEYGGKTWSVRTSAALKPGLSYTGVFIQKKGFMEFLPRAEKFFPAGKTLPPSGFSRLGEAGTREYSRFILSTVFFREGLSLPRGAALEELLRFVHRKDRRELISRSALAARCEAKGLSLRAEDYETLYAVFEGYSGGGEERRENGKRNGGKAPQEKALSATASAGEEDRGGVLLQLFNSMKGGAETWVVYPYRCTVEDAAYRGSLRVLYDPEEKTAKKYVLAVRGTEGQWHFTWNPPQSALKIYFLPFSVDGLPADSRKPFNPGNFSRAWIRKFRKYGLYSDDTIYTGENFDGFSEELQPGEPVNEMA
ncbi:MAG: hypothetical protein LBK13_04205 [Spirochaetales bacterium]|jgi:hypothetical protein|nr:hypothetical protein [Spirochaetales bacterium]